MRSAIITVAAQKGGVGKTTLAYELTAALDGVLVDLDHHGGGATNLWGFDPRSARSAPLLDALENASTPRPKRRNNRPPLVPSHPDLSAAELEPSDISEAMERWAISWTPKPLVIDTHPGDHPTTNGALQVADLVVVPVPPGRREIAALQEMLSDHHGFPILLVPNMLPSSPPEWWVDELEALAQAEEVNLAPPITEHRWLRNRLLTTPVIRQRRPGRRTEVAAEQFRKAAERTAELCQTTTTK
jgi:chromosome partitioning protein